MPNISTNPRPNPVAEQWRIALRPIPGPGGMIPAGTVIDVSSFRNLRALVDQGRVSDYAVPAPTAYVEVTE